jgi:branched-subunit amino acid aminotransferase/4-amino-4-deoxychorismate lyase
VLEGATSNRLWWRGDVLCAPPRETTLPGVTQTLLLDLARADGLRTERPSATGLADLAGCEVWVVNALHGIRPVTAWIGCTIPPFAATRAASWNARLDGLAERVAPR